jgi:hypothetical protein
MLPKHSSPSSSVIVGRPLNVSSNLSRSKTSALTGESITAIGERRRPLKEVTCANSFKWIEHVWLLATIVLICMPN